MNGTDRLERELTTWFADTAAPQTPDWTADILAATSTMRQRPRWSFPARWLPAAVVPRLPRLTLRPVPWRTIALLALLGLLLAAAVTLYVGSRPRLPAPFGPAVNGLVAYAENGDIWTVDPVTGEREAIVTLPGADKAPRWSRDGTRVAFLRRTLAGTCSRSRRPMAATWSCRRARRFSTPTRTRSPGHRTALVAVVANGGVGADDLPRRYDHRRGPGPRHPGRRRRGVLAPARRAPTHVHPRYRRRTTARPCPVDGGVRMREDSAIPIATSGRVAGRRMGSTSSSTATTTTPTEHGPNSSIPRPERPSGSRSRSAGYRTTVSSSSGTACSGELTLLCVMPLSGGDLRPDCRPTLHARVRAHRRAAVVARRPLDRRVPAGRKHRLGPPRPRGRTGDHAGLVGARRRILATKAP